MKNMRLNPGGVIGAILLMATVIVMAILLSSRETVGSRIGSFGVIGLFLGAFGGNYLWEHWFPKNK